MKNKILQTILASLGLAASLNATTIPEQTVTFVNVKDLGTDLVVNDDTKGSIPVNTTILARNQRWTRDRVYLLENNVIVPSGKTLIIEPGTIVRAARPTVLSGGSTANLPADPGALLIARGGKLIAKGTFDAPIVFTTMDDPYVKGGIATIPDYENFGATTTSTIRNFRTGGTKVNLSSGVYTLRGGTLRVNGTGTPAITDGARPYLTSKTAVTPNATIHNIEGSWGGIVLCGYATLVKNYSANTIASDSGVAAGNPTINPTTGVITGSQAGLELVEGMAGYPIHGFGGGDDDNDSSGCLSFIDNRYGGFVIAASKELNSYSFYGVGKNTVLEFLADYNNADDSFEFWGGAANLRRAVSAYPGDDGLDTDQGYLGVCQYYVQIHNNSVLEDGTTESGRAAQNIGDNTSENDGSESVNSAKPYTIYTLANATFISRGYNDKAFGGLSDARDPSTGPCFKDNGSAQWFNCIIADASHGAVMVTDRNRGDNNVTNHNLGDTYAEADDANDSNGRFGDIRSSGGFDGANRADDLVTQQTGRPATPDGLFNNCFFYRCGLAQHQYVWQANGSTKSGKYATRLDFDNAVTSLGTAAYTAADSNLFPGATDRKERHGGTDTQKHRANVPVVVTAIRDNNANVFNTLPFANDIPYKHRLGGLDIKPSSAAKNLANSALPARRGINTGANFAGAVRDSAWYAGWNFASLTDSNIGKANVFGNVVPEVPVVAVSVDSGTGKPKITFGAVSGYKYVVERSTDNRLFTEVETVLANEASESVVDPATWTGTPVFYRVITL